MKYLFWIFQILCLIIASIPVYFAWTNQMMFRIGLEKSGKWGITFTMFLVFMFAEAVIWYVWRQKKGEK